MSQTARFEMPTKWDLVPLGDHLTLINGRAYKQDELLDEGTPIIRIQNLNGGDRWYYSDLELPPNKYCEKGDLLFAWSATFGPYIWNGPKSIYHYHIWKILPRKTIDKRYAYWMLDWITESIKAAAHGITMVHITKTSMEDWKIPLPPLAEQQRIAAILDKADALRAKRRAALAKLDTLLQATFLHMFGDPVTNPMGWEVMTLGDIAENLRYGTSTPPGYVDEGIPFIRATNIKNGTVVENDLRFISEEAASKIEKCKIKYGDLVIVRSGVNSGDCALIPSKYDNAYAGYDIIFELPFDWAVFANHFINSPQGQLIIKPMTRRAGQPHLNAEQVKSIGLLKPSLSAIQKFRETWEKIEAMKRRHGDSLEFMSNLFHSLQQRAFKGELAPP